MIEWDEIPHRYRHSYLVAGRRPDTSIATWSFDDLKDSVVGLAGPAVSDVTVFDYATNERWLASRTSQENFFVINERPLPGGHDTTDYAGYYEAITDG